MTWVFQGHIEKIPLLEKILDESKTPPRQIAYIGDDLTDIVIMRRVGLSFATGNARPETKAAASVVTDAVGGSGAVREAVEVMLKARGVWDELLKKYEVKL
jgi:3-deoxy-D-manno-octulosonate 8-phosphate phosphatase (KDO 8-P phosphatase)